MGEFLGTRIYLNEEGSLALPPGGYGKDRVGVWHVRPQAGQAGVLNDRWKVEEHANGTITVIPSIHIFGVYHGYLTQGVWTEC